MGEKNSKQEIGEMNQKKIKLIITILLMLIVIIIAIFILFRKTPTYNVSFNSNGGSLIDTIIIEENGIITEPKEPTREDYEFVGWYYNDEPFDFSKPITSDIRLEARWAKLASITGIKLDKTELTLKIGEKYKLTATLMPANNGNKIVIWKSSNSDIVSVDSNGNIEALKEGKVTITVMTKDGKHTAKVDVSVIENNTVIDTSANNIENVSSNTNQQKPNENQNSTSNNEEKPSNKNEQDKVPENMNVKVTGIDLNKFSLNLTEGDTERLIATVKPSNATNKNVIWESSNPNVVSVDSNGNIKALKEGNATITVKTKDGGYTAKAQIVVNRKNVNVVGVSLNKTTLNLTEGETSKLTATINPSNATNKNVTWASSNTNIVSVDTNGNIRALKAGTATITVTTEDGNHKATCQVTVQEKAPIYNVIFTPIVQEGTGAITQYSVVVTKNNSVFNECKFINYNGTIVKKTLSSTKYNRSITSVTIRLNEGTDVIATVIYK